MNAAVRDFRLGRHFVAVDADATQPNGRNEYGHIMDHIQRGVMGAIGCARFNFVVNRLSRRLNEHAIGLLSHIVCPLIWRVLYEEGDRDFPENWRRYGDDLPGALAGPFPSGATRRTNHVYDEDEHWNEAVETIRGSPAIVTMLRTLVTTGAYVAPPIIDGVNPCDDLDLIDEDIEHIPGNQGNNEMAAALAASMAEARSRLQALSRNTIVAMGMNPNDENALEEMGFRLEGGRRNTRKHRKNRKSRRSTKNRKASRKNRSRKH